MFRILCNISLGSPYLSIKKFEIRLEICEGMQ